MPKKRSKNPDLLFSDVIKERTPKVIDYYTKNKKNIPHLDRVTLIVTHRCNYRCTYCNGPHTGFNKDRLEEKKEMLKKDLNFEDFKKMISDWSDVGLTQIHFTGGEPTLNKDLLKMVRLASKKGILTSITTNGSANKKLYSNLIKSGMTEIRISIDAGEEKDYDHIVGVKKHFPKVIENIKEIVRMRDREKEDVFLVFNSVVGKINLEKTKDFLKFLISLKPNDIKILVVSMERDEISKKKSKEFIDELNGLIKGYPKDQFVLLRDKISKMFDPNAQGLKDNKTQKVMEHCFVSVTERTHTPSHYYPCSIYIRAFGKPIGKNTDSFEIQQEKLLNFVKNNDCRIDSICSRICTNCCKIYNNHVNKELKKWKKKTKK
uniref:Radical SAM protein n=1 Tax=candidate division CPR3 bacterium TaxID=2268181 RepID=A0A7C4R5U8_UNCC3